MTAPSEFGSSEFQYIELLRFMSVDEMPGSQLTRRDREIIKKALKYHDKVVKERDELRELIREIYANQNG